MTDRSGHETAIGRRLFVAIPIPTPVRDAVTALVDGVRSAGDPAVRDVRWVRLDGLHLTVRFLGPTEDEHVADVAAAVDQTARRLDPFESSSRAAGHSRPSPGPGRCGSASPRA